MASKFITINDDPTKGPKVELEDTGSDLFVLVDGVRVAERGRPRTSAAGTWVSLVEGYTVATPADLGTIEILVHGKRLLN
jgi:hypothetical protein